MLRKVRKKENGGGVKMIKKSILFMILIPLLTIFSIGNLTLTKCSEATPQIVDVYVQGYENQKYTSQNFTAFVNSTVVYKVKSDSSLNAFNYDGAEVYVQEELNSQNIYYVTIACDKTLNTQLVLQNDAGCTFSNINFIDNIDSVKILAPIMVNKNYDNVFNIQYNGNDKLKYQGKEAYYKMWLSTGDRMMGNGIFGISERPLLGNLAQDFNSYQLWAFVKNSEHKLCLECRPVWGSENISDGEELGKYIFKCLIDRLKV